VLCFCNSSTWAEVANDRAEGGQPEARSDKDKTGVKEDRPTWKYLVERTIKSHDHLKEKRTGSRMRAFVYFGPGGKKAGGTVDGEPEVVYIDKKNNRVPDEHEPTTLIHIYFKDKFTLTPKMPWGFGSNKEGHPVLVDGLQSYIEVFPIGPEQEQEMAPGLSWSPTVYFSFWGLESLFEPTIKHEVKGYKEKRGRRCAVIEYFITGEKTIEPPDLYKNARFNYSLQGDGTAYFDPVEEIIVSKKQTITWRTQSEKFDQLDDGSIGLVTKHNVEKTVNLSVSLVPEGQRTCRLRVIAYLLVAAGIGLIIAVLVLLRKKASSDSK